MKLKKSKKYNNVYSYSAKKGTRYAFRFPYFDIAGNRHEKQKRGFNTEIAAHKAELQLEIQYANNDIQQITDSSMTMNEWIKIFFEISHSHWRKSTEAGYRSTLNKYIIPLLGKCRLDQLTKPRYDYLFIQPLLKKIAPNTVHQYHRLVMLIMNTAVDNEILIRNRLSGFKFAHGKQRIAFERADLDAFNQQLSKMPPEFKPFFMLLELTGMRRGEALALSWEDVDLENGFISISKTRSFYGIGPTKTVAGTRKIAIAKTLVHTLKQLKLFQRAKCLRLSDRFKQKSLVFTNGKNEPLDPKTALRYFHRALTWAGIDPDKYVIHCLRHTHATYLLDSGANPVDVAKRLGHANASVTLSIYSHAIKGNDRKIAEQMAQIANF